MIVQVEFYSGARDDESPRALVVDGIKLKVKRILRRELIGSTNATFRSYRFFTVETEDGALWNLREAPDEINGWSVSSA